MVFNDIYYILAMLEFPFKVTNAFLGKANLAVDRWKGFAPLICPRTVAIVRDISHVNGFLVKGRREARSP